jgi:hypothetical protein
MRLGWIAALNGSESTSDVFCTCSAGAITVATTVEPLSLVSSSRLALVTVAVLLTDGAAGMVTATVSVMSGSDWPGSRNGGCVQVTTWPAALQVQPEPVPETKLRPAGSVSVTTIGLSSRSMFSPVPLLTRSV